MTPTPTTRASLLCRLRDSQDHEAGVEFIEIYEPAVYRQLRKCGLQDADARELMQELFVAVNRQIARWELAKERGLFRGWLRRVARNLVINWMKHGQRRMVALGGPESQSMFDELAAEDCPEPAEFDRELRRSIFQRASELVRQEQSLKAWQAFWETAVVGKTPIAVSQELGMSAGAVRVAKCRVLARLKEVVRELESDS
ncbi:MAG: sigma-70 family RNA polymerase sigma factor [Planctomycetaceae bacterium]|nr:sigma-70 family RNA polymerase sigma factor [Planctomycetaceae bacterium]